MRHVPSDFIEGLAGASTLVGLTALMRFGMRRSNTISALWYACAIAITGYAQLLVPPISASSPAENVRLRDMRIPVFGSDSSKPVGFLTIGRISRDSQTKGFLKISALPLIVARDVELNINTDADCLKALESACSILASRHGNIPVELRGLRVVAKVGDTLEIKAGRAKPTKDGGIQLDHGVEISKGSTRFSGESALLAANPSNLLLVTCTQEQAKPPFQRTVFAFP